MKKKTKLISVIITFIIILMIVIAALAMSKKEKVEYVTALVERGSIKQTVSETGNVKASSEINLNFLNTGKVDKIFVKIGDEVIRGQVLIELDYSGLSIKEEEAKANLEVTQANLAKLLEGAPKEEIAIAQASANQAYATYQGAISDLEKTKNTVEENITQAKKTLNDLELKTANDITPYEQAVTLAEINLDNAISTYSQSITNKQTTAISTIDNKLTVAGTALDTIYTILNDNEMKNNLSIKDIIYLDKTDESYNQAIDFDIIANTSLDEAKQNKTTENINLALIDTLSLLNQTLLALDNCYNALENTIASGDLTQTELDTYKTSVSSDLSSISTAITSIETAQHNLVDAELSYTTNIATTQENLTKAQTDLDNAINNARNALITAELSGDQQITSAEAKVETTREAYEVAKAQLVQVKAPARAQDITLQRAHVKQAQAALDSIINQIEDSIIKAPIDGTITKIEYEVGEQTQMSMPAISMLAENHYEVEVLVSESDIAKIKLNDPVEITLDAFGDDVKLKGLIFFIEPAETEVQDVIYYKIKVSFNREESNLTNVKSGMTANVIITTAQKEDVLIIPNRAVIARNGDKIVRVLVNGEISEVPVTIGLRGDEGMVEILSGLNEGEEIVTFIKENN